MHYCIKFKIQSMYIASVMTILVLISPIYAESIKKDLSNSNYIEELLNKSIKNTVYAKDLWLNEETNITLYESFLNDLRNRFLNEEDFDEFEVYIKNRYRYFSTDTSIYSLALSDAYKRCYLQRVANQIIERKFDMDRFDTQFLKLRPNFISSLSDNENKGLENENIASAVLTILKNYNYIVEKNGKPHEGEKSILTIMNSKPKTFIQDKDIPSMVIRMVNTEMIRVVQVEILKLFVKKDGDANLFFEEKEKYFESFFTDSELKNISFPFYKIVNARYNDLKIAIKNGSNVQNENINSGFWVSDIF